MIPGIGRLLRRHTPASVKTLVPVRTKARLRAWLGLDVFPDLAVRHRLFRSAEYAAMRRAARVFDEQKRGKPVMERPHQASYVVARWLAAARVGSAFHVGFASGRYLFYLSGVGIAGGGTDLPETETYWTERVAARLEPAVSRRLLTRDFFDLGPGDVRAAWEGTLPIDVCFSEATFETLLPWRDGRVSVPKYGELDQTALRALMLERFPDKVAELAACFRNFVFIEPEPTAGGPAPSSTPARVGCPGSTTACGRSGRRWTRSSGSPRAHPSARRPTPTRAIPPSCRRSHPTRSATAPPASRRTAARPRCGRRPCRAGARRTRPS